MILSIFIFASLLYVCGGVTQSLAHGIKLRLSDFGTYYSHFFVCLRLDIICVYIFIWQGEDDYYNSTLAASLWQDNFNNNTVSILHLHFFNLSSLSYHFSNFKNIYLLDKLEFPSVVKYLICKILSTIVLFFIFSSFLRQSLTMYPWLASLEHPM